MNQLSINQSVNQVAGWSVSRPIGWSISEVTHQWKETWWNLFAGVSSHCCVVGLSQRRNWRRTKTRNEWIANSISELSLRIACIQRGACQTEHVGRKHHGHMPDVVLSPGLHRFCTVCIPSRNMFLHFVLGWEKIGIELVDVKGVGVLQFLSGKLKTSKARSR